MSLLDQKTKKESFCEEKWSKKVVQFQNGISEKKTSQGVGSIPEWNSKSRLLKVGWFKSLMELEIETAQGQQELSRTNKKQYK